MLPCVVCFRALLIKFENTCEIRLPSVLSMTVILGSSHTMLTVSGHLNLNVLLSVLQSSLRSVNDFFIETSPASTRERSRISLISVSKRELLLSIISMYFMRSSCDSVSHMTLEKPSIALSGVLISWLILAKNNDFMRFARSASFAFASYSPIFFWRPKNLISAASALEFASFIFAISSLRSSWFIIFNFSRCN